MENAWESGIRTSVISGDFSPSRKLRILKRMLMVLAAILGLIVLAWSIVYGFSVYLETNLIDKGQETRIINEENKELQVKLMRLQGYQMLETAAQAKPGLHLAEEVVVLKKQPGPQAAPKFPTPPPRKFLPIHGY